MSQENVEIVRDWMAASNEGDFSRALEYYHDDIELFVSGDAFLEGGTFRGREAVGQWFGEWFRSFQRGYHFELEEVRDVGNTVLFVARHGGKGKASGVEVEGTTAYVVRVRDEKIVFLGLFFTRQD